MRRNEKRQMTRLLKLQIITALVNLIVALINLIVRLLDSR